MMGWVAVSSSMENYYKPLITGEMDFSAKMSNGQQVLFKIHELTA